MKVGAFVYASVCPIFKRIDYRAYPSKSEIWGGTLVCETEIEFQEPEYGDILNGTIAEMRKSQQEIRAKAEVQVQSIEQTIGELLAIEDKS